MSRGLLFSLNRGSRLLFLATFLLLVPSLMGVYAVGTTAILDNHLVRLQELRIQADAKDWERAKQELGEPTSELSAEDQETLQQVARAFEAYLSAPPPSTVGQQRRFPRARNSGDN